MNRRLMGTFQYVLCPLHKRNFSLVGGEHLDDVDHQIRSFDGTKAPPDNKLTRQLLLPRNDV